MIVRDLCAFVDADEALSKSGVARADLELEMSKLRQEVSDLRDSLLKTQNLNETLAQDKSELNAVLMQVGQRYFFYISFDTTAKINDKSRRNFRAKSTTSLKTHCKVDEMARNLEQNPT